VHATLTALMADFETLQSTGMPEVADVLRRYRAHSDRSQIRLQMVRLYYQGWDKVSLRRFLGISRTTVDRWIERFETEHFAGLIDHQRGPKWPRKVVPGEGLLKDKCDPPIPLKVLGEAKGRT